MFQQLAKPLGPDATHHRRTNWPRNGTTLRCAYELASNRFTLVTPTDYRTKRRVACN